MIQLDHLRAVAGVFCATELTRGKGAAQYQVEITLASMATALYSLQVIALTGGRVAVREDPAAKLPRCCPDRHINQDGTFCLNWDEANPLPVVDEASARRWWDYLVKFLRCQEVASALRKWVCPGYAHGDAAKYQRQAEQAATRLGPQVMSWFDEGRLLTRRRERHGRVRIELLKDGVVLARVSQRSGQLTDRKAPCICSAQDACPIAECGEHAADLQALVTALYEWRIRELSFIRDLSRSGIRCCRTLEQCSLA
jgi:hypothetical protein